MNEEIIAINQDALADYPEEIYKDESIRIYSRTLENGDIAYGLFNLSDEERTVKPDLPACKSVRDVWAKEDLNADALIPLDPHGARIFRVTPA